MVMQQNHTGITVGAVTLQNHVFFNSSYISSNGTSISSNNSNPNMSNVYIYAMQEGKQVKNLSQLTLSAIYVKPFLGVVFSILLIVGR